MELFTLLLIILTASLCLYHFVLSKLTYFERLKIPYVQPIPFLGNLAPFVFGRMNPMEIQQKIYNLYPDAKYLGFYMFLKPVFMIRDPELISTIAIKQFDNFCNHSGFENKNVDPMVGKNLFNLQGDHWREMRRLLTPSFTSSKMKTMFGLMSQCAENFVNFVATESEKTGKTYNMRDILSRYANDTIATCAFGISVDSFKYPNNEFFMHGSKASTFDVWKLFRIFMIGCFPRLAKLFKLTTFGQKTEGFFKDIVVNTVKTRDEQGIVRPDMIQLMMESRNKDSGAKFDIDDMTIQAFMFFTAGFDSVSLIMCFMTHEVAVNPDVQNKLREEIDDVLRQTNGKPTYESINRMKYLDAVVNETLRLYPVSPFTDRVCVKETELPPATSDGKPIMLKPGDSIMLPGFSLHRDPKYFPHPDKFDPERFMFLNRLNINDSVYIPFGIGPRICIGNKFAIMEAKVMLFHLLWHCDLEPDVKTKIPVVFKKRSVFLTADEGFWLKLRARDSKILVTQ